MTRGISHPGQESETDRMPPTDDDDAHHDEYAPTKRKIARLLLRSALRQARRLHVGLLLPRKHRLAKDARAVKSLMADARAAGLVPTPHRADSRRRRVR